jgi:hypothetical protein
MLIHEPVKETGNLQEATMAEDSKVPDEELTGQQAIDDDVQGHHRRHGFADDEDDVEGHHRRHGVTGDDDDVQGHHRRHGVTGDDEDDVEGHHRRHG